MKTCIACKETKPKEDFYTHPRMADGYLGRCKECQKALSKSRDKEKRRAYERIRAKRPERKAAMLDCQRKRRANNPAKSRAWNATSEARRNGKLIPQPCLVCENPKTEAHHPDYGRKLDVLWLCFEHHRALHCGTLCLI